MRAIAGDGAAAGAGPAPGPPIRVCGELEGTCPGAGAVAPTLGAGGGAGAAGRAIPAGAPGADGAAPTTDAQSGHWFP